MTRFDLSGRKALVTGSSRGIGAATARLLAASGARVALHYNKAREAAEGVLASLEGEGHAIFQAELGDPEAARKLVADAVEALGGLDLLVNNAGIFEYHPLTEVSYDQWQDHWQRTISLNLMGPAWLSWCAGRHMVEQGGGKIINITSRGAFRGEPDSPAYGASKAGMNSLSQSLAKALAPHKVLVYAVAPGFVETDMAAFLLDSPVGEEIRRQSPLGRTARPEEMARIIAFLASEGTDYLTGSIIDANGASYLRN